MKTKQLFSLLLGAMTLPFVLCDEAAKLNTAASTGTESVNSPSSDWRRSDAAGSEVVDRYDEGAAEWDCGDGIRTIDESAPSVDVDGVGGSSEATNYIKTLISVDDRSTNAASDILQEPLLSFSVMSSFAVSGVSVSFRIDVAKAARFSEQLYFSSSLGSSVDSFKSLSIAESSTYPHQQVHAATTPTCLPSTSPPDQREATAQQTEVFSFSFSA